MLNLYIHFYELKLKVFYFLFCFCSTFICSYFFILELIYLFVSPFLFFVKIEDSDFIFTDVFEIFNLYLSLAFNISLFLSLFVFLYLVLSYLKTGLFLYEKNLLYSFLSYLIFLTLFSLCFLYFLFFPSFFSFVFNLNIIAEDKFFILKMNLRLYEYLGLISTFCFVYSFFLFQLPLFVFFFFAYKRKLSIGFFYTKRRFWLFFCCLLSLFFSTPEFFNFCLLFLPLCLAFEITTFVFLLKNFYLVRNKRVARTVKGKFAKLWPILN